MKTFTAYTLLVLLILTLTGCPEPLCLNPNPSYSFAVTAHFTPEQDSIQVGDTLYLISEFPSTMVPIGGTNMHVVDFSNSVGISSTLGILHLSENKTYEDAVSRFDYISITGEIFNSKEVPSHERVQQLLFKESLNTYQLKIGIIPKTKGLFSVIIGDGRSAGLKSNRCEIAAFRFSFSNRNRHSYLYDNWLKPDVMPDQNYRYLFKVY